MANAPYEVNVSGTDDETFAFTVEFEMTDESGFPFADYAIEYAVTRRGSTVLRLTQGNGITVETPTIEFRAPRGALCAGQYEHGCRIRHLSSGDQFQVFNGSVTINEGSF
jgi:hypothetical protein